MKQFKPVIICAVVLLVISLAGFAAMKLLPEETDEKTPVIPTDKESIMVCDVPYADVVSVSVSSDDGDKFTAAFGKDGGVMQDNVSGFSYDAFALENLRNYASRLSAKEELGDGEDADFGFDTPRREISFVTKDGEEITLLLGDSLPVGDGAYVRRKNSSSVYIVGQTAEEIFLRKKVDYRDAVLFDKIESTDGIISAEYTPYGGKTIKIVKRSEEDIERDLGKYKVRVGHMMTSPVKILANPDTCDAEFLSKIIAISGHTVCEDNPKDLKQYGLDKPARLSFETKDKKTTLLIGRDADVGGTYVMVEGVPSVILSENAIGLEKLTHTTLVYKLLWFFTTDEADSFEYKLPSGESHKLTISVSDNKITGTYDGGKISDKNAKNLYLRTIRFNLSGAISEDIKYASSPAIEIRANLKDGRVSTFTLYEINDRQYAASVDGKMPDFFVPVSEVRELLDAFGIISRGEEIPDMF